MNPIICKCGQSIVAVATGETQSVSCPACGAIVPVHAGEVAADVETEGFEVVAESKQEEAESVYRLADEEAPAQKSKPVVHVERECPWCNKPLPPGAATCADCGWNRIRAKKGRSKKSTLERQYEIDRELARRRAGVKDLKPVGWLQIIFAALHPKHVLLPSVGLALASVLAVIFVPLAMYCLVSAGAGVAGGGDESIFRYGGALIALPAFVLPFWVLGRAVNRYLAAASKAATHQEWDMKRYGNMKAAAYYLMLGLVALFPPFLVLMGYLVAEKQQAFRVLPQWYWFAGVGGSLVLGIALASMGLVVSAVTRDMPASPRMVIRWTWKCFFHILIAFLFIPLWTALVGVLFTAAMIVVPFLIRPDLRDKAQELRNEAAHATQQQRQDQGYWKQLLQKYQQDSGAKEDMQIAAVAFLVAVSIPAFFVHHLHLAACYCLGLIVRKREKSLGWFQQYWEMR